METEKRREIDGIESERERERKRRNGGTAGEEGFRCMPVCMGTYACVCMQHGASD